MGLIGYLCNKMWITKDNFIKHELLVEVNQLDIIQNIIVPRSFW
jgi:hypothetical protein